MWPSIAKCMLKILQSNILPKDKKANISSNTRLKTPPLSPLPCSPSHTAPHRPFISPYIFVHVWMNLKCEWLLQQRGKADGGDQPAHVERHGCSLMWLQLGSPGPNEVLWSPASAPAPSSHRLHTSSPHTALAAPFRIIKGLLLHSSGDPESKLENKKINS